MRSSEGAATDHKPVEGPAAAPAADSDVSAGLHGWSGGKATRSKP